MFGQQNTSPFGSTAQTTSTPFGGQQQRQQTTAFGSPAPAFGAATTTTGFGASTATPGFGQAQQQQQPQSSAFGGGFAPSAASATTGSAFGGAFGSSTTQNTSPFGAPAPAPLFGGGAAPAQGGMFSGGTTSAFGTTGATAQPQTGGFGSSTTSTGGGGAGFGQQTNTAGFGASSAPTPFGVTTPSSSGGSLFGAPAPSAFGAAAPSTSLFGGSSAAAAPASAGQSMFGGSPTAQQGGMFGQQQQQTVQGGTGAVPFQTTSKQDGTQTIVFQSITAMPQYEKQSFEELRFQDYSQGNRGTQQQGGGGTFGSTTTTAFGQAQSPTPAPSAFGGAFGGGGAPAPAPSTGLFGAPAPTATSTFGGFGAPAPAPTGGFFGSTPTPAPAPAFGGFGATPAPAQGGFFGGGAPAPAPTGVFGAQAPAPAPTSLFGAPAAPATGGSVFGSNPAPAPTAFGGFTQTPAPAQGGFFGGGAPAPGPSTGGMFGSPAPAPSSTSLFGASAPAAGTSPFGSTTPAPAPSTGFGGFGAGQPAPAPAFGTQASGGSLFGAPAPGASLFSGSTQQSSLFGAPSAAQAPATQAFGSTQATIVPPPADAVLQQQLAAIENQRKELEQMDVWRGGSPQSSSVIPSSNPQSQGLRVSPYSPPITSAVPYRASPRSTVKIRPRGFDSATPKLASSQQHAPLPFMSPDGFVASSTKRLVIKSDTPKPSMRLRLMDVAAEESKEESKDDVILRLPSVTSPTVQAHVTSPPASDTPVSPPAPAAAPTPPDSTKVTESTPTNGHGYDFYNKVIASAGRTPGSATESPDARESSQESLVPKLTTPGYTVLPSIEQMEAMSEAELATVSGFTVSRSGVGSVSWDGSVDVRGVDLDEVISIENRDVAVYDTSEENGTKPGVGTKLNRSAVITMYGVFPKEGSDEAAIEKFERKIAKTTKNMNAELIYYHPDEGMWKFRVPHFSRYALLDSDSEDEMEPRPATETMKNFHSGVRGGRSPEGHEERKKAHIDLDQRRLNAFVVEDEEMLDVFNGGEREGGVQFAAESAYKAMSAMLESERIQKRKQEMKRKEEKEEAKMREEATAIFPDKGVSMDNAAVVSDSVPRRPTEEELAVCSRPGISRRIAQKCGFQSFSLSSTDYGMRMGRSFRVGWKPDGSFLHLQPGSGIVLQQSSPVFTDGIVGEAENATLLETHLEHASRRSTPHLLECPTFCLSPADDNGLRKALSDYVSASAITGKDNSDPEESLVLMRAFSLLLCLFASGNSQVRNAVDVHAIEAADDSKAQVALREQRIIVSCVHWLREACAQDVRNDVRAALDTNDIHYAIYAAISGGDIKQACVLAKQYGYLRLATLLSTGVSNVDAICDQVQQWNESEAAQSIPAELLCIYTLLGGDLDSVGQVHLECVRAGTRSNLDWRRRLCMLLTFGSHPNDEATLASLIKRYGAEIALNTVPYPCPRYIWNEQVVEEGGPHSLLYKILGLTSSMSECAAETGSLSDVVAPSGYTPTVSDFSGAFHIAAALSALGVGGKLSPFEQVTILDSYASQLVSCGRWDLAVYVMLCSFGTDRQEDLLSRQRVAKAIVLQNFADFPEGASVQFRSRLERIGVPSEWFEETLAYRCGNRGDAYYYIRHLSEFSPEEARKALEELVVPNMLFKAPGDAEGSLSILNAFSWEEDTLARTVVDLFQLGEDIMSLSQSQEEESKSEELPLLIEMAKSVKERLLAHRSYVERIQDPSCSLRMNPNYRVVPTSHFLAEALDGVSLLQLQLGALRAGSTIWDDAYLRGTSMRRLKVASELAFICARNLGDTAVDDEEITLASLI